MGRYINLLEGLADEKCISLVNRGAKRLEAVPAWDEIPDDKALICIGDNGVFQYAAYVCDEGEYREFTRPEHTEPKHWFLMDKALAEELAA